MEPDEFPPEEDFPEEFMPPPIRDDFHISRDEIPQNNYIQDKGTFFAFSLNVRIHGRFVLESEHNVVGFYYRFVDEYQHLFD